MMKGWGGGGGGGGKQFKKLCSVLLDCFSEY